LTDWITWRNDCPEEEIYSADAIFADKLGLPTLAALCSALDQITKASGRFDPKEIEAILRPVLSIALGQPTVICDQLLKTETMVDQSQDEDEFQEQAGGMTI